MKRIILILAFAAIAVCEGLSQTKAVWGEGLNQIQKAQVSAIAGRRPQAEVDSVSYLLGINFGSMIKGYDFGNVNFSEVKKGIDDYLAAKGNEKDPAFVLQFKINPEENWGIMDRYLQERHEAKTEINSIYEEVYLTAMAGKGYRKTDSGLLYRIIAPGSASKVELGDSVTVYYTGTTPTGVVFDECEEDNARTFPVEEGGLIQGWVEGLKLIGAGGTISLVIPSKDAYGENGASQAGIEPNMPILFTITVVNDEKK